ncbi:AfsA-related hotdog domain-containing protein [Actinosynnema sp. NPDC059797]
MSHESLVVVGDRFAEFLGNRGTIPVSALLWRLRGHDGTPLAVTVGQGLTAAQLAELSELAARTGGQVSLHGHAGFVDKRLTHKRDPRNVLIGEPQQVDDRTFTAPLVVDENTETLDDHLTGQHIPAIALTEAARQTWTAVTEKFLVDGTDRTRFVINDFASSFHSYVFPLPTALVYRLLEVRNSPVGRTFRCRVEFVQSDAVAAVVSAEYRVIPERFSEKQEAMAARAAVKRHLVEQPVLAGTA